MDTELRGKTALVTGGSSGIGRGIALALAAEGVDLAVASRNPDPSAIEEVRRHGVRCLALRADVSREEEVVRMVREAIEGLGGLDIYVNNAAWAWHQPVTRIDSASWFATINTNLSACVWACREVARHMVARRRGSIVIISSTSRFTLNLREAAYRVSKVGTRAYAETLAIELAPHGIRVNTITPGHYRTRLTGNVPEEIERKMLDIIPLHRFGNTLEIGRAVAFLASDAISPYTTGADLVVDGGLSLRPLPLVDPREAEALNLGEP
jgi:3-oxoacyl-[acyl-carrier protein] reductase